MATTVPGAFSTQWWIVVVKRWTDIVGISSKKIGSNPSNRTVRHRKSSTSDVSLRAATVFVACCWLIFLAPVIERATLNGAFCYQQYKHRDKNGNTSLRSPERREESKRNWLFCTNHEICFAFVLRIIHPQGEVKVIEGREGSGSHYHVDCAIFNDDSTLARYPLRALA